MTYATLALTAQRLIQAKGRSLSIVKRSEVSSDSAKPWRSSDGADVTVTAIGVVVPSEFRDENGNLIRRGGMTAYVAALDSGVNRLEDFDKLLDGTDVWKIEGGALLAPGDTSVLYELYLKR